MSFPGAAEPPPGFQPDVDNPEDVLRTCNYVVQALTIVFVTVFVATRYYAKSRVLGGGFTWDDVATYLAYVFMIGYCMTACFASAHGGGLNIWEVRPEEIQPFFQSGYAATLFYAPMALTVKLALLLITIRVFGAVHKKTLIGVKLFIGMLLVYYISGWFIKLFICGVDFSAYWKGEKEHCLNQRAIIIADAIISVISDLVILLLPTPLTWSLQLPKRKRLRVTGLLCAGGVATAFSIYRLAMVVEEGNSINQTVVFIKVILSGNAEIGIGLICACLPAVNALFVQHGRGSSYFKQSQSTRGEIMLTRSFHIDTTRGVKQDDLDLDPGHDETALVSDIRANAPSGTSSQRSTSIC